jgi:hypothetical protein
MISQMPSLHVTLTSAQKYEGKKVVGPYRQGVETRRLPRPKKELHRHPSRGASLRRQIRLQQGYRAPPRGRFVSRVEAGKWGLGILGGARTSKTACARAVGRRGAALSILRCHYQIGKSVKRRHGPGRPFFKTTHQIRLGPPTTDDTRPNGLNHVLLLLSSIDGRSLVSTRCDVFRVDAHPLPSLFSKRAGPLDASFFPGFSHFCFWFSHQVCWFLYFYGFLLDFLRFLCFLFIFSFLFKKILNSFIF